MDWEKKFIKEFEEISSFSNNSLLYLRKEFELIVYSALVYIINLRLKSKQSTENNNYIKALIFKHKNDFLNPIIVKEMTFLQKVKNFSDFSNNNYDKICNTKINIFTSQYAYECFFIFLKQNNLINFQNELENQRFVKIKISQEKNPNYEFLRFNFDLKEIENKNKIKIQPQMPIDDQLLIQQLDKICQKQESYESNGQQEKVKLAYDIPIQHKIDFSKNYLDRKILSQENQPSIINVSDLQVTCMEIQNNGNILLVGFQNSEIYSYKINNEYLKQDQQQLNIENEERQIQYRGHEGPITSLSLLYDEKFFISSSTDCTIRLYSLLQSQCLAIYKGHVNTIWKTVFSHKGVYFASGSSDWSARLWQTNKLSSIKIFIGHQSDVTNLQFMPNPQYLITAAQDSQMRIWDINSGDCVKILFHQQEIVSSITFGRNFMISGSEDGSLILWDLNTFKIISMFFLDSSLDKGINNKIISISISSDEEYFLCMSKKRIAYYSLKEIIQSSSKDIFDDFSNELQKLCIQQQDKVQSINYFDNMNTEMFLNAKFHPKNFIILASNKNEIC